MRFFKETEKATFRARLNRFVLDCELRGRKVKAYLPNPGRLWELFFPGCTLHLERAEGKGRKMKWTAVAVERNGRPIVLDTHSANRVAGLLLEQRRVPGLEKARVVRSEVKHGSSRFDFLLREGGREVYLEVKSCTLFSGGMAMFPDAVTDRGRRHVEELAALDGRRERGVVLFLVQSSEARFFLPEYHVDHAFTEALVEAGKKIRIIPLSVGWTNDLLLEDRVKTIEIPWEIVRREAGDRGAYLVILRLRRKRVLEVGRLGRIAFEKGFYIYAGSAARGLTKRLARHRRRGKKLFWHIDYLREAAEFHAAIPVVTRDDLECSLARAVRDTGAEEVGGFGASDCNCPSHLFRMEGDPLDSRRFMEIVLHFRMDRLITPELAGKITPSSRR